MIGILISIIGLVFASQPMSGLTSDKIEEQLCDTKSWLRQYFGTDIEVFTKILR